MAKYDARINAHGINVSRLSAGMWVVVHFNDSKPQVGLLTEVEKRKESFKGDRDIKVLFFEVDGWKAFEHAVHTQIVGLVGSVERDSYADAIKAAKKLKYLK